MELVVHFGEVLLHLVELHAFHVDPRVLLTVCNAGLQAHVQVGVRMVVVVAPIAWKVMSMVFMPLVRIFRPFRSAGA